MAKWHRRIDVIAVGAFVAVAAAGYQQAASLASSIALWDTGLEHQRLDDAAPTVLGTGAVLAAAAVALLLDHKPRAALCVAPAAVVPPLLAVAHASAGGTLLVSLGAVSLAVGGACGAMFSHRRPARRLHQHQETP